MVNKPSYMWALGLGLMFLVLLVFVYIFLLAGEGQPSSLMDYLVFFLAGTLIGAGVVYLLRKTKNIRSYRAVITAFVISLPFTLFGMVIGVNLGPVGVFFLGVSPSLFFAIVGYFIGSIVTRR